MNRYAKISALFFLAAFCAAAWVNPVFAAAKWTFMVYLDGDNNLEGDGLTDFLEMAEVGSNANINIVVQMDRIDGYDSKYGDWTGCKRFRVTQNMEPASGNALQDLGEANMGDPETLKSFINWATTNYPAERYALILWDHGSGWQKKRNNSNSVPIYKGVCWDDSNNHDGLFMSEVKSVLNSVSVKPDMIGFDACLMGMIENAYMLKDLGPDVMVGSEENEPGFGWPYNTILQGLNSNPGWTSSQLGSWIVDKYYESYQNDQTQSAIDLSKVNALGTAVSDFATALRTSWNADKNAVTNAAQVVMNRIEDAVINSKVGEMWRGAQGLSVYFPLDSDTFSSAYNQTAFAANTYWEEFLNEYYNSMTGSWIEAARKQAVYFAGEDHAEYFPYIDIHHFCSLLAESADTSPGYSVQQTAYNFEDISGTGARMSIRDDEYVRISPSGFTLSYYENTYTSFSVSDNGVIFFEDYADSAHENEAVPGSTQWGSRFIAPYWDDFSGAVIYWQVKGTGNDKRLIIQWNEVIPYMGTSKGPVLNTGTFQSALYPNGRILCQYKDTDFGDSVWNKGNSATVGVQGAKSRGLQYSYNSEKITSQSALLFIPATEGSCSYLLSSTEKSFGSAGGDGTVPVTSEGGCNWTALSNVSWISITEGKTGAGNGTVRYTVSSNTELSPRTGTMTIAEQTFTVNQSAPCSFEISPSEKTFSGDSDGSGMIEVKASASGCTWNASSQVPWINITSGSSGTGSGTVWYSVQKNSGDRRTGKIIAGDITFTVTQDASSSAEATLLANGVAVKNISQELGGGVYYKIQVPSGAVSLEISTQGGTGDCHLMARHGDKPATDIYDASSEGYGNDEVISIPSPQAGDWYILLYAYQTFGGVSLTAAYNTQACSYTLSPSSLNFSASGGNGSFNINTGSNCFWTASASVSWIELLGGFSGMGNGKIDFRVLQNTDTAGRVGTITVMDQTFSVAQNSAGTAQIITLENDATQTGLSGQTGSTRYYKISVPSNQSVLKVELWGGEGDCDLYIKYGQNPTFENYDNLSDHYGNDETVNVQNPQSGDWYIMVYGYDDYSDVSLKAAYISGGTICNYTLSQTEISVENYGGSGNITVTANSGCSWNTLSYYDWIIITSGSSGTGAGTVSYSVLSNEDLNERIGTVEIAGNLVFITQRGTSSVISLSKGVPVSGLSGAGGGNLFFKIDVPSGQKNLIIDSWGGTGDFDMYVRYGALPATDAYDFKCFAWGNDENVHISNPDAGEWYILLNAWEDSSNASIKAEYNTLDCNYTVSPMSRWFDASGGYGTLSVNTGGSCSWTAIKHGTWIEITSERRGTGNGSVTYSVPPSTSPDIQTNNIRIADQWITVIQAGTVETAPKTLINNMAQTVSDSRGSNAYYQIDVPVGQESLVFETSGGTGDCDLYVRYGELPTFRRYDFMSYLEGNGESVTVENTRSGKWYVMLNAYSDYSGVSLKAQYKAALCTYVLSETEISVGSSAKESSITVTGNSGCAWTAFSNSEWIILTSGTSGTGNGRVDCSISENGSWNERIGTITIANIPVTIKQQGIASSVTSLSNGVTVNGLSGVWGDSLFFSIKVPEGQKNLIIDSWGGAGDADMYVSFNALPTDTVYDFQCYAWGNDENVYIRDPQEGWWYILLYGYDEFSGASLKAEYNIYDCNYTVSPMRESFDAAGGYGTLSVNAGNGCLWTAISHGGWIEITSERRVTGNGSVTYWVPPNEGTNIRANNIRFADQWVTVVQAGTVRTAPEKLIIGDVKYVSGDYDTLYYQIDVPSGLSNLVIKTQGGTGDCNLYVRYGEVPTFRVYDVVSYRTGNDETVTIRNPKSGAWYVMVYGNYSDVSLNAEVGDKAEDNSRLEDAVAILRIMTGLSSSLFMNLDFDGDGKTSNTDAVYVLQSIAGLRDTTEARMSAPVQYVKQRLSAESR